MPGLHDHKAHRARIAELDALLQDLSDSGNPALEAKTREIVQILLELHGETLAIVMDHLEDPTQPAADVRNALIDDELVAGVLLLHGLHPVDFKTRVLQALDKSRPYLKTHGGDVELLAVADGVVRLKLQGSCHGCPSSAVTLKQAIEDALYEKAPDLVALEVEGVVEEPAEPPRVNTGLVQLTAHGTALSA